jgi:hypothetical protein
MSVTPGYASAPFVRCGKKLKSCIPVNFDGSSFEIKRRYINDVISETLEETN